MRRDCDGDEASVSLLLDVLLNFSREYLPAHRGGTQDAPLVLNSRLRVSEVDDMVLNLDIVNEYPLELYEAAEEGKPPYDVKIEQVQDRLETDLECFRKLGFTHDTKCLSDGVVCSNYKRIPLMSEKVKREMELCTKIRAVDASDVARIMIERHFIRDIRGNLRKFSIQTFRCVGCNEKFRRPPLAGTCSKCGGKIIFTIHEGGIVKYLDLALNIAEEFNVPNYVKESLEVTKKYIESVFGREAEKQEALEKWF